MPAISSSPQQNLIYTDGAKLDVATWLAINHKYYLTKTWTPHNGNWFVAELIAILQALQHFYTSHFSYHGNIHMYVSDSLSSLLVIASLSHITKLSSVLISIRFIIHSLRDKGTSFKFLTDSLTFCEIKSQI